MRDCWFNRFVRSFAKNAQDDRVAGDTAQDDRVAAFAAQDDIALDSAFEDLLG